MKKIAIRATALIVFLGSLAGAGVVSNTFDFGLTSGEGEPEATPPEDKVKKGKLAGDDLNSDGESGWSELASGPAVTREDKRKPRLAEGGAFFAAQFVCHKSGSDPEVIYFVPVHTEARTVRAAFRRKDPIEKEGRAKGGSKLLSQRLAEYENDGGGGITGAEKANAVLDQIRSMVQNPACESIQLKTRDPASETNPDGLERVWTVVPQPAPDLGDTPGPGDPKNAVHFRAVSKIGGPDPDDPEANTTEEVTVENDMVIVRRGRVLMVMTETSPGGHPNAAEEAKGRAAKADTKLHGSLSS